MSDFLSATAAYEEKVAEHLPVVSSELEAKHQHMSENEFMFLRATYYRWAEEFPKVCPDLTVAPVVMSVGDLHCENYGSWRNDKNQLVWGVNDLDEVWPLPYANDLVRLATSLRLAHEQGGFDMEPKDMCKAILKGYQTAAETVRTPFIVEHGNGHKHLREMVEDSLSTTAKFKHKIEALPAIAEYEVPVAARSALLDEMPASCTNLRYATRTAGLGSLGRRRYVLSGELNGDLVVRECKDALPSAAAWASDREAKPLYEKMLESAVRSPDPNYHCRGDWVVRSLSPDNQAIELESLTKNQDREKLLESMGAELANIHFGTRSPNKVLADLAQRSPDWLNQASKAMESSVSADWQSWRRAYAPAKMNALT